MTIIMTMIQETKLQCYLVAPTWMLHLGWHVSGFYWRFVSGAFYIVSGVSSNIWTFLSMNDNQSSNQTINQLTDWLIDLSQSSVIIKNLRNVSATTLDLVFYEEFSLCQPAIDSVWKKLVPIKSQRCPSLFGEDINDESHDEKFLQIVLSFVFLPKSSFITMFYKKGSVFHHLPWGGVSRGLFWYYGMFENIRVVFSSSYPYCTRWMCFWVPTPRKAFCSRR